MRSKRRARKSTALLESICFENKKPKQTQLCEVLGKVTPDFTSKHTKLNSRKQ